METKYLGLSRDALASSIVGDLGEANEYFGGNKASLYQNQNISESGQ